MRGRAAFWPRCPGWNASRDHDDGRRGRVDAVSFGVRVNLDPAYNGFTRAFARDAINTALEAGEFVANITPFEQDPTDG